MLPKELRLQRGFSVIFQKGAKIVTPFFVLRAVPAFDEKPRLAISVSRKTEKSAVRRNRIRRRLIAAAEVAGFSTISAKPFRIVIIGHHAALDAPFLELCAAFENVFDKLEQWRFPMLQGQKAKDEKK